MPLFSMKEELSSVGLQGEKNRKGYYGKWRSKRRNEIKDNPNELHD